MRCKRSCFIDQNKPALREQFRQRCSEIPLDDRQNAALQAANIFANLTVFAQSQHIACYLSFKNEFNTAPLIEKIWQANKICYVPVLAENNILHFVRYEYGDVLHLNRYSILEPADISRSINAVELELVITPLVAFDAACHRLGAGGGYYDRTFEFKHHHAGKPHLIGLGYALQQTENLCVDVWDIKLEGVVTEKAFVVPA